ncbi:Golgi-associated plant pathogenesis-related protein 1 isoform X2 [Spea bombifrons]|uniref:Golgi-associated plant pathogenesis-related protein 1 isoform X2 n=1 Tax=Spea bombifrons TaxID=233779 RepID=UPI00234B4E12|nr:Golgi-associated plant pathogenesis-related protein 1 isoform X2 [Spea bombifrons]
MTFNQRFAGLRLQDQGVNLKKFEEDFLSAHNSYRKKHGAPPLRLNPGLCQSAQKWADHLLSIRSLQHSNSNHGENLFYKYSSRAKELPGHEPVDSWYSEIKNYNFSKPGFGGNTGHFTQVVWKDSKEVGVGVATDGNGLFFVVGQYDPAGNITNPGYFEKNVLPAGSAPSTDSAGSGSLGNQGSRDDSRPSKSTSDTKPASLPGRKGAEESQFEKDFLSAHNAYRKRHGAPPLQLNRDLCRSAQQWADHLLSIRTLKHSASDHGENLYYKYSSNSRELPGHEPVDSWYDEIKNYDFARPGFRSNTGHFTQVVWKDSKEVGVGVATDGNSLFFVVGQYDPAGNITNPGFFEKNVLPAGSAPSTDSAGSGSRWKPSSTRDPEPDKPSSERNAQAGIGRRGAGAFEQEALDTHNKYRRQHGAPALTLNQELCESSQKWANHLLSINALQHSNTTHGENLWYKWNSSMRDASGSEVVDTWYGEIKDYNFSKPGFQSNTGHFTQVVWKDSRELGIAKAVDGKGMVIAVAQYSPAGNITNPGYFQKNVLPKGTPVSDVGAAAPERSTSGPYYPGAIRADTAATPTDSREFALEFLNANNTYRSRHGAKPLQLNSRISQEAQKWAEHLLTLKTLKHSETSYGENIWAKSGGPSITVTGQEVADSWYKEEKNYNFSKPGYQADTGHFTQMVWKTSKEVGVGLASSGKGMFIVVAQYNPSGNITNPGFYARNVLPRGSKVTDDDDDEDGFAKETGANGVVAIPEKELKAFRKDLLNEHNKYRRLHGSGALQLSTVLIQEAQKWADHLAGIRALQNSDTQHGENLWYRWGTDTSLPTGKEVAESWYNEISKYNFSNPGFQSGSGNFTQMVWKSSSQVGFGLSTDSKGMYIAVGFYDPAGNIANKGYFEDNVLQKKK